MGVIGDRYWCWV